ncbi:MFS transporter [Croceicoccus sp. BE223]|uniref:MFS transporter n=1 Tax=Croceicoccus sp. BE223 TaxID=2817716 RepID=UPI0028571274|nr:MFS transporter [Croceicoccus sp. BE223]MDR7101732.1 MFS family permease [Croceicoccus sp. BE223]
MTATAIRPGMREEMRGGWRVLVASLVGVSLGLSALPFYTLGVVAGPMAADLGWSRADILSGLLFSMIATVVMAGPTGSLIDRFGARAVAIAGQVGLVCGLAGLGLQGDGPTMWKAAWFAMAAVSLGTTPLTWSRGIAGWFNAGRGTALGIALSGSGLTAIVAPPLIGEVVAQAGWRAAYFAMAGAVALVALPTTLLLFHARPSKGSSAHAASVPESGLTLAEALRGYRFWLILAAFAAISFGVGGAIPNLVPMLAEAGVADAAFYASILGVTVIAGRLLAGWLLDRFWAPLVALVLLGVPSIACILIAREVSPGLAAALVGLAGGAEFDLIAYLCSRYFGMRSFGRIYAWQWAGFALAAGVGSTAFAAVRDAAGSYDPALYLAAMLMAGGGASLLALGRYPDWTGKDPVPPGPSRPTP